ncbi:hypothetical protein ACHWQZ_G014958 [Mnemiopsis leidyi]
MLVRYLIVQGLKKFYGPLQWDSTWIVKKYSTTQAPVIWFALWTATGAFIMANYDPLKGKLCGDPKHYPEHSKPERFKETRFFLSKV